MVSTRSKDRTTNTAQANPDNPEANVDSWTRVLCTGANAGLGLDTCRRIITEFLQSRPDDQRLHLIVTTRSSAKSNNTIRTLWKHACTVRPSLKPHDDSPSSQLKITSAELDLTHLPSVVHASRQLRSELPSLHAIICNAGISGWTAINWPWAVWLALTDLVDSVTYPPYMVHALGLRTKPQLPKESGLEEPPLNQVFCANVLGHYILAHELGPLLSAAHPPHPGRVVWVSSTEANREDFIPSDLQCLDRTGAYNSSKRLTDILALSSMLKSTQPYVKSFFSEPDESGPSHALNPQPRQYVCHPGIVATDIMPLHPVVHWAKKMSFYLARALGSPWHTIVGSKAAVSMAWVTLSPQTTLDTIEERDGPGKWGSATDWWGHERVKRTEVQGWGFGGKVEASALPGEHRRGRRRGARDVTEEEIEQFEELGVECWRQMEEMRKDWMTLMEKSGAI